MMERQNETERWNIDPYIVSELDDRERQYIVHMQAMQEQRLHDAWEAGKFAGREIEREARKHTDWLARMMAFLLGFASALVIALWATFHALQP